MRNYVRPLIITLTAVLAIGLVVLFIDKAGPMDVLNPAGVVAESQKQLMITATLLMLIVVLPVFWFTFYISWKYRATNKKARYEPEWDHNRRLETIWWGVPLAIIVVLAGIAWSSSHSLDPGKPLASANKPLTIQVVALQWKWLFLYPEQEIASVNYVQFPANRPVNFQITADAPMNSFWIPRLGGQMYAMAGMTTPLQLMADKPGSFYGTSANLSGTGFSKMQFTAEATTEMEFKDWVVSTRQSGNALSLAAYTALARPGVPPSSLQYASYETGLYDTVLMKYMDKSRAMPGMVHD